MKPKKATHSLSDRRLRGLLADQREDVAAPADFRAQVMRRLQAEGLVEAAPVTTPVRPALAARLAAWLTPLRLGAAAAMGLALVVVLHETPAPVKAPSVVAVVLGSEAAVSTVKSELASKPSSRAEAPSAELASVSEKQIAPETALGESRHFESSPAVATGASEASAPTTHMSAAGAAASSTENQASTGAGSPLPGAAGVTSASVDPKPTVVVVEATPTAVVQPLRGNSELRGNVIRASEGGYAVLLYRVLKPGHVHAELFDRLGQSISVLRDQDQAVGTYELKWAGGSDRGGFAPSGIYVLRLSAPGYNAQHKLLLVK